MGERDEAFISNHLIVKVEFHGLHLLRQYKTLLNCTALLFITSIYTFSLPLQARQIRCAKPEEIQRLLCVTIFSEGSEINCRREMIFIQTLRKFYSVDLQLNKDIRI